jgi:hypothetical protein
MEALVKNEATEVSSDHINLTIKAGGGVLTFILRSMGSLWNIVGKIVK